MCRLFLRRGFVGLGFSKIRVLSFFSLCIYKKFYTLRFALPPFVAMSDCQALVKCSTRCRAVSFWTAAVVVALFSALYTILVKMVFKQAFIATEYANSINQIGFWIHATTGTAYYAVGFMQFSDHLRRRHPVVHRATGYAYYVSAAVTSIGIALLCIGGAMAAESMVTATLIVWPLWMYWMYESFVAVRMGDIQRHRDLFELARIRARPCHCGHATHHDCPDSHLRHYAESGAKDRCMDLLDRLNSWRRGTTSVGVS
jgi:hypothetical protein